MADRDFGAPKPSLAHRGDLSLGDAIVRPSLRTLEGPSGSAALEPKVMQVLLAFVDAGGAVITREDLVRDCWGGRIVGDDAVNRTIAELRRLFRQTGASCAIETIPKIGYRLHSGAASDSATPDEMSATGKAGVSRRAAASAIAALTIAGGASWWWGPGRGDPTSDRLIERGRRVLYNGFPDSGARAAALLTAAVRLTPDNAEAWGLLAFAHRDIAEGGKPGDVSRAIGASEAAARRALELDSNQGDALAALASLRPYFGDIAAGEDRLLKVLASHPDNVLTINQMVMLTQGVGLVRQSAAWNDRNLRLDPHSPVPQYRRALKLWSLGQLEEADQAIDRAMQLWPRHPSVWNARMMLFAFTGRPEAGLALLDEERSRPATLRRPGLDLWRVSLRALRSRSASDVRAAREANVAAAPRSPGFANAAMPTLAMLGELDSAFDVAFGYFLRRGPLVTTLWEGAGELPVAALRWRRSLALFVPPAAAMRADPRFMTLMDGMGITRYWRQRNVRPDYQLSAA